MSRYPLVARYYILLIIALGMATSIAAAWLEWPRLVAYSIPTAILAIVGCGVMSFYVRHNKTELSLALILWALAITAFPPVVIATAAPLAAAGSEIIKRRAWYRVLFNAGQVALTVVVASHCYQILSDGSPRLLDSSRDYLGLACLALTYYLMNLGLIAVIVSLTTGKSFRSAWKSSAEGLFIPYVGMTAAGGLVAALAREYQSLLPLMAVFAALAWNSLKESTLRDEAQVEAKTGLYNSRYFAAAFNKELSRMARLGRPLAVVMVDIDYLREINNSRGHLAGDAVIRGVADVIRLNMRDYDTAARFGGEEFSIVLPEIAGSEAAAVAERIRCRVAEMDFVTPTSTIPVRATISLGVACYPINGLETDVLMHQADLALYSAKLHGRNRVCMATSNAETGSPAGETDRSSYPQVS